MNTCLLTGSTSGIGKATAIQLSRLGWHMIIHGRKEKDCQVLKEEIKEKTGNDNVDYVISDLSLMKSVKRMAEEVTERFPELNILINNAGTFSTTRVLTAEGIEITWAVNYLSRFLLVTALLPVLKKNAPSRIVDVAGAYHNKGMIHFSDISLERNYSYQRANNQAKLANVLFTYKLAEVLAGTCVTSNCLHPGAVNTGAILKKEGVSPIMKQIYRLMRFLLKTPDQGAETSVYLGSSPLIESVTGKYFVDKKIKKSARETYDKNLQDDLWTLSERMIEKALSK